MTDLDVRALQVRRLDAPTLDLLHRRERARGARMLQWEIARWYGLPDLKAAYGIPTRGIARRRALRAWGDAVRKAVSRQVRERRLRPSLEDLDRLHAFDDAMRGLDLGWRAADTQAPAKDWFEP